MRHQRKVKKLGRRLGHRSSLLSNLVLSLIEHGRIRTTVAKAKATRPLAEKMITLAKRGDLHARRQAFAFLRQKDAVSKLFETLAPLSATRQGGYTRITKLGARMSDSAPMAFIEWVDQPAVEEAPVKDEASASDTAAPAETPAKAAKAKAETSEAAADGEAAAPKKRAAKKAAPKKDVE